jgi:hypothetical protein
MITHLNALAVSLVQEVGFDIVSLWDQGGFLLKAVALVFVLAVAFLIGVLVSRAVKRTHRDV